MNNQTGINTYLICITVFLCLAVVSCKEDPFFIIDVPAQIEFDAGGGELTYHIKTNAAWFSKVNAEWCRVVPLAENEADLQLGVKIICDPNELPDPRECVISFSSGDAFVNVVVSQKLKTYFSVSPAFFEVFSEEQTISIEVSTTEDYLVEVEKEAESWLSVQSTRSLSTGTVLVAVAANDTYGERIGKIFFTQMESGNKEVVTVAQAQNDYAGVSNNIFNLSCEKQTVDFEVDANVEWELVIPEDAKSWLSASFGASTKALESHVVKITVAENKTYSERQASILVSWNGGENKEVVMIHQDQNDYLGLSKKFFEVSREESVVEFEVTSNVAWEILVPDNAKNWISVASEAGTRALETAPVRLAIAANKSYSDRAATVYISQTGGGLRDSVSITQIHDVYIKASQPEGVLSKAKQSFQVSVEANTGYVVASLPDWITYNKSKSKYPTMLQFAVTANQSYFPRTGEVVLRESKGDRTGSFTVTQAPSDCLVALTDSIKVGSDPAMAEVKLSTNVAYDIEIPEKDMEWISVSSAPQVEALSDVSASIIIERNDLYIDRSSKVVIRQRDGNLSRSVVISQSQKLLNPSSEYIVVFGDIQYYTNASRIGLFSKSLNWITRQVDNGSSINCVLHTGDVTNSDNLTEEWVYFSDAIRDFYPKIPFISAIGDHDYRWEDGIHITDRNETYFSWFLKLRTTKVIAAYDWGHMENVVIENKIHGQRYDILCLEFGPRKEVVEWADRYVTAHPDIKFILLNHEYLEASGGIRTDSSKLKCVKRLKKNTYLLPEQLWEQFIKTNNNVAFVICGHVGGLYALTLSENDLGRLTPQIQHNIQGTAYKYDNWLMLWEFPAEGDYASVKIVNTVSGKVYDDKEELFSFRYRY